MSNLCRAYKWLQRKSIGGLSLLVGLVLRGHYIYLEPTELARQTTCSIHQLDISIIVVNFNGHRWLQQCLGAAVRQLSTAFELIVVDNGSSDGSVDLITKSFPEVRLVTLPENLGFAAGNNIGAKSARGRYLAFLNNDAEPQPHWLQSLRRRSIFIRTQRSLPRASCSCTIRRLWIVPAMA